MITTVPQTWGHKVLPPSYDDCLNSARRAKRYEVEASSYSLFQRALEAKESNWSGRHVVRPAATLPPENVAAIQLLDLWLSAPKVERDDAGEEFRATVNKYRTNRKVF